MIESVWHGCYDESWGPLLVPEAFSHPAKFSCGLIRRIIEHGLERGWFKKGDILGDPFGGVACGGIIAASYGLRWIGIELEDRFCKLGAGFDCPGMSKAEWVRWYGRGKRNKGICLDCQDYRDAAGYKKNSGQIPNPPAHRFLGNIDLHRATWEQMGDPIPVLIQGDSRNFAALVHDAVAIISSPPYAECLQGDGHGIDFSKAKEGSLRGSAARDNIGCEYGATTGQLGAMKAGELAGVISSPPYVSGGHHPDQTGAWGGRAQTVPQELAGYGATPGQLGQLPPGDLAGIVSSPPFEKCDNRGGTKMADGYFARIGGIRTSDDIVPNTIGQLGNKSGETYWSAVAQVYSECLKALRPGGVMVLVVKDYIKNRQRVPLCEQTLELLTHLGFEPVERIRAMLVKEHKSKGLFGEHVKRKERKSFFRRLAEAKGSPRIDYEEVLVVRKGKDSP